MSLNSDSTEMKTITLRVAEAQAKDVGRGIARLDPRDIERLGATISDIVEIRGGRATPVKLMPAYHADRGKGIVQIDGIVRQNAQVGLGEKVSLHKVDYQTARSVTLKRLTTTRALPRGSDSRYMGRLLEGLVLTPGDRVRVNLFGTRAVDFTVADCAPAGVVIVGRNTAVRIKGDGTLDGRAPQMTYEDIGGLYREIQRIREMIELPLKYPEVFDRLGIDAPKGVLLHGPPGCGKTLIARAVANETAAYFTHVSGPEVIHKYYGESLKGDTLVLVLKDGLLERRPIADIVAQRDATLRVPCFGPDGKIQFGQVTGFHKHPFNGRLLRVHTASGRSIRVTDDHSLFTLDADGVKSIKTSELVVGQSFVAVPKRLPFVAEPPGKLNLLPLLRNEDRIAVRGPYVEQIIRQAIEVLGRERCAVLLEVKKRYVYDLWTKHVGVRLPRFLRLAEAADLPVDPERLTLSTTRRRKGIPAVLTLSEDLCAFFGLWLAEGSFSKERSVRISIHVDEKDTVVALCTRLFGDVTVYYPNGKNSVDVFVSSLPLVRAMQGLGFVHGARRKRVPAFVYNLSRPNLAALLRGYISGDGSVNRTTPAPQIEVRTASTALADDVCHLLLYFGIVAKVYDCAAEKSKRVCFADAEHLERFLEIGFLDASKNDVIRRYLAKTPASRRDRIPLAAVQDQLGWKVNAWNGLSSIGTVAAKRRFESLPASLEPALEGDLFWDKVVAIEELPDHPEFVYDIAVEPGENFVAGFGGVFAHNSEAHLRAIFEEAARHAPAIIFLDEIDAIAPKRQEVQGEVEKRVVAQLLALMDGLKSRGSIIVIGATNIPNVLDPALRRPGRFDREIAISIPDRNGRLEILQIHTRGMPLADDVDLEKLAQITHGFVGADLQALCREAAMITLRKIMPDIDFAEASIPYERLLELEVTQDAFLGALAEIEPSAIREVFTEVPDVKWDDVGGLEEVKRILQETIEWPLKYEDLFKQARTTPPKGILLTGPPGCGKTLLAKAVASESETNFISVKGPALMSKYVGESEKGVREVFKKARQASPCIVFFDELDALAPLRGSGDSTHVSERVVSQFLTEMDGIEDLKGVVVLGASNRPDIIDPALLRAGRFDVVLELPVPDRASRLAIFQVHTRGKPLADDPSAGSGQAVDLEALADLSEGLVGADIESICRQASMLAIREFLEQNEGQQLDYQRFQIAMRHFRAALRLALSPVEVEVTGMPGAS